MGFPLLFLSYRAQGWSEPREYRPVAAAFDSRVLSCTATNSALSRPNYHRVGASLRASGAAAVGTRSQPQSGAQLSEQQPRGIGYVGTRSLDDHDPACHGAEVRPEVHRALEQQDRVVRRFHAEMAEHRLVGRLLLAARDHDSHLAAPEQRHRTKLEARAEIERPGARESTVAHSLYPVLRAQGRVARRTRARAQAQGNGRTLPGLMSASRCLGITDDAGQRTLDPRIDQRADQAHGVGVAAGPRVVLSVDQDRRSAALRRRSLDELERAVDRADLESKLTLPAADALGEQTRG